MVARQQRRHQNKRLLVFRIVDGLHLTRVDLHPSMLTSFKNSLTESLLTMSCFMKVSNCQYLRYNVLIMLFIRRLKCKQKLAESLKFLI